MYIMEAYLFIGKESNTHIFMNVNDIDPTDSASVLAGSLINARLMDNNDHIIIIRTDINNALHILSIQDEIKSETIIDVNHIINVVMQLMINGVGDAYMIRISMDECAITIDKKVAGISPVPQLVRPVIWFLNTIKCYFPAYQQPN